MAAKSNLWSFCLMVFCAGVSGYSLYSSYRNVWLIAPSSDYMLVFTVAALVLGIIGLRDKRNGWRIARGWLTVSLFFLLAAALVLIQIVKIFTGGSEDPLQTVHSPDRSYTIHFYRWDEGAAGTFGIRGELDGPLWFKKRIYVEPRVEKVEAEWTSDQTVSINGHPLDLDRGETYGY
ncbi:DUF5412 family protein [Cohnella sp. AR92]|uniref:DUF5412 family protein n=1 Tax=Cohnella sp. AR92 TaxID=648716 RepID=UPI000F8DD192|nr:DUF5412 family protein [Cohnella sp. AR92]RUS45026.1 hypothetical protein ELR57_21025 [Cohnella sp. AR92]